MFQIRTLQNLPLYVDGMLFRFIDRLDTYF
jgi:hypothetical protein